MESGRGACRRPPGPPLGTQVLTIAETFSSQNETPRTSTNVHSLRTRYRPLNHFRHLFRNYNIYKQESPADADKPARLKRMQKLLQFDVFRFISPNSIPPNFKLPMHSFTRYVQALGLYCCTQFEIRCLPIIKFLV